MSTENPRIAVMWRGDARAPDASTRHEERLRPVLDALTKAEFAPEPAIYFDDRAEEVRSRLLRCAGVLVWINPIADGADRQIVDRVLREVAATGVWVSAHPDVIGKMGAKRVLFDTRSLGWGSDTDLYMNAGEFDERFARRVARGPRVLKPNRGNDGQGILKVSAAGIDLYDVQRASDDATERVTGAQLKAAVQPLFDEYSPVIDQEFHEVTSGGMVRCYMTGRSVIGFGLQAPRIQSTTEAFGMRSEKEMHGADFARLADLRASLEHDWAPAMMRVLSITDRDLPALWDADFLYRAQPDQNGNRFALCEINASCVSPFPTSAPEMIAKAVDLMLRPSR
jgi:hypothetical protein